MTSDRCARPLVVLLIALFVGACGNGDGAAEDQGGPSGASADSGGGSVNAEGTTVRASDPVPREGEMLRAVDWDSFFEPGDDWRQYEQVLVFNNGAEPETLDPHLMTGVPEHTLATALFEGLTSQHPRTLEPLPGVAEWWEISDDGKTYTFHLREDARWSNGDPVTAEDFRWSWLRALDPGTGSQYAYQLFVLQNGEAYYRGAVKDPAEVGVSAPDPRTLVVQLHSPTAYFLHLANFETLMPAHRATVERHGPQWTQPGNFVGNGPFVLRRWLPRDEIVMEPNPHWWNRRIIRLERIHVKPIDDDNTAYNLYLAGTVDWLKTVPRGRIEEVQLHPDYYTWPYLGTYFYRFNVQRPPFDDVRVRKAFNLAIDKQDICVNVLKAGQTPATGFVPPVIRGYEPIEGPAYDPSEARRLLAEAGYPGGAGFPDVELTYNTNEGHKRVAEVIGAMLREKLGVTVKPRNMEWKTYLETVDTMQYQIARAGWIGDYPDPNTFLDMWLTGGGNNSTGWSNPRYDELIKGAAREPDLERREEMLQEAERLLCVEDLPILPIYFYVNEGMLRPRVRGLLENVQDLHPFQYVWLDGPPATK